MAEGNTGLFLALIGLVLLLATGLGRQRGRSRKTPPTLQFLLWQRWGTIAAFLFMAAGLLLMWAQK